jgi:hypothetical protein
MYDVIFFRMSGRSGHSPSVIGFPQFLVGRRGVTKGQLIVR